MDFKDILYEFDNRVAFITINRENVRNALRPQTYEELTKAMHIAADDEAVGVVVLRGAGDKAFSSGGDIKSQSTRTPNDCRIHMRRVFALSHVMRTMGKPIIASVRGFCVGGGHELHLFCDLTIASSDSKFGQTGPRVGSVPIWGACQLLARFVGERKAREIIYLCKQYSAQEALEMGLVNEVVEPQDLVQRTREVAGEVLSKSPQSIRIAKAALNAGSDHDFHSSFFHSAEAFANIYGNQENMEGINAFLEKRDPDFFRFRPNHD